MNGFRCSLVLLLGLLPAFAACPGPETSPVPPAEPGAHALVLHGAFGGDAVLATVSLEDRSVRDELVALQGSDWVTASSDGDPWLIGRFQVDTVRRYDDLDFGAPSVEFSAGTPANPYGLAVCADTLFVLRYGVVAEGGGGDIALFDPLSGEAEGAIDLSDWADGADGTPEPASLVHDGDRLYVGLQRLDRDDGWQPVASGGRVLEVDCVSREVVDSWTTVGNVTVLAHPAGDGRLLARGRGGLQVLDPRPGGDGVGELVISEADGGFEILSAAGSDGALMLAVEDRLSGENQLLCYDTADWEQPPTLLARHDSRNWGLKAAPDGTVWAVWRDHWLTAEPDEGGLGVYDPVACEQIGDWLTFPSEPLHVGFHTEQEAD